MLLSTLVSFLVLVGQTPGSTDSRELLASSTRIEATWFAGSYQQALQAAQAEQRDLLLYFFADGSVQCNRMWTETLIAAGDNGDLEASLNFGIRVTDPEGVELTRKFSITTLPTILIVDPKGRIVDGVFGFLQLPEFQSQLARIRSGVGTLRSLREAMESAPGDLQKRFDFALKLDQLGFSKESRAEFRKIEASDPRGNSEVGAQVLLWLAQSAIVDGASNPSDPTSFDLKPIYELLPRLKHAPVALSGWEWVERMEEVRGDRKAVRSAIRSAWEFMPNNRIREAGMRGAWKFWDMREELDRKEKRFALAMAREAWALAEAEIEAGRFEVFDVEWAAWQPHPLDVLGSALYLNGKRDEALKALERSLSFDDSIPQRRELRDLIRGE